MLHVSAPKKRRVGPGALLDLVLIGKIADEDVNDLLLGFVDIDRSQAGKQLVPWKKQVWGPHPRSCGRFQAASLAINYQLHWKARSNSKFGTMHPSPLRPTALSPQNQLTRWCPRNTPVPLALAAPAAHRTAKLNHVGPPSQGQE